MVNSDMGLIFVFFCFCIFFGTSTKIQKIRPLERDPGKAKQETTKIADHMSTDSDKSPNGVCNFDFCFFEVFAWSTPDGQNLENPKKKKLQTTCPQSQTRAPMGSAVLFFLDFRGFCMVCFAVYCCYHIKLPFTLRNPCRTLQNLAKSKLSHLPPPSPPALFF